DLESGVEESPEAIDLPQEHSSIIFRNVSFGYNGEQVLRNVEFEARSGEVIAIVGTSGAGKSTLLDLIARFYDPDEGKIEFDGHDLRKVKRSSLLEKIAVVTQQTFLFNTSLEENIRYARPDATEDEIVDAARMAQIDDFIRSQPEGYHSVVGEGGVKLSGGQRQRISLARSFLKNAQILILDEATSELDSETEKKVQNSLREAADGRTTFVVAHRLSTVKEADSIIVLDNGKVVEQGSHEELMALDGHYCRLYNYQFNEEQSVP
ncbi:MAG: ATP-binding cassette domain-containing protein, partial [Planctomycetota bacterium]|nr:ATP-binding cassette domain-containing protein [Planctomycetota bacterium]